MSIDALRARLPEAFRDARLKLSALASEEVLAEPTKWGLLLACAIATRNAEVRDAFAAEAAARLPEEVQQAARAAATVMAMNNVYYRAVHLASNNEYAKMPARLRMNVIANPGVAEGSTSSCGAWRCRRLTVAAPASTRTRRCCVTRASPPRRSTQRCATLRLSSLPRWRSKRRRRRSRAPL